MAKDLLDIERDEYTEHGVRCANEVIAALRVIKQRYVKEGFKAKEVYLIIKEVCSSKF